MVQPINYMAQIPQVDLARSLTSGLQLGATYRQMQDQRIAAEQAAQAKQQFATDLQAAQTNGGQQAWLNMIGKYPQFREAFGDVRKGIGEEQVKNEFSSGFDVSTALENKNPEVAKQKLQVLIDANKNSGKPTGIYQQAYDLIDTGEITAAQAGINKALSILDPDRFEKTVKAQSTAAKAPSEINEAIAKSQKAVNDARVAVATATDDIAKAKAESELKVIELKYKDQVEQDALKQRAAALNLTKSQIGSALASTKKLGLESQKAALELEALKAGGLDPVKAFEQEEKLRKEYQVRNKVYSDLNSTYANIKSSSEAKTGPGDVALITGFMKMLDPGSVVRETEFATARDTAGLYAALENNLKKAQSGQFLQPKQRNEFVTLAKQYLDSAQKKSASDKKALGVVVKNYKLNPENVFGPETAAPAEIQPPGAAPAAPASRNVTVDY